MNPLSHLLPAARTSTALGALLTGLLSFSLRAADPPAETNPTPPVSASEAEAEPEKLSLPPGLYEVQARATDVGTVIVPVVIAPGRRTDVFLDARGMPAKEAAGLTDPVRLADGRVVGPRAEATPSGE